MSVVRRAWLYGLTLVSLGILAAGVRQLLSLLFDLLIRGSLAQVRAGLVPRELSLGLAMIVIGGPLWYIFWRTVQRNITGSPIEIGAGLRKLYLNLVRLVAAIIVLIAGADLLRWLIAGAHSLDFSPAGLAIFLTMLTVWYYHWRVNEDEGQPSAISRTLRRWYIYIICGWGLVWITLGIIELVNLALVSLPVWGDTLVSGSFWTNPAQLRVAWIVVGGLAWYLHWFHMSSVDVDSTLRQIYLYLLTILGSAVGGLVALIYLLYKLLMGLFGGAGQLYWQFLAWTIPTVMVTAAIWVYHVRVAQEEAAGVHEHRLSARRVYFYLMSLLGLGTMVGGLIILIGLLLDLVVNAASPDGASVVAEWWRAQLSAAIAMLLVSVPIWLYYWGRTMEMAATGGIIEWRARSRRVYLYLIIFVGIVTLAADLVNIIYQLLSALLSGTTADQLVRALKWSLQSLVVAVPLLYYHWMIARQDQKRGAEAAAVHKSVTLLVDPESAKIISQLEEKLGFKVQLLRCRSKSDQPVTSDQNLDALVDQIKAAPTPRVMVTACGGVIQVLPYEDW